MLTEVVYLLNGNSEVTWIFGRGRVYTRVTEVECSYKPRVSLL